MLKYLNIHNLILIEQAEISLHDGLNIISGETGSGKSAVMQALKLIAGEKSEARFIRHGADKASIEALFELPPASTITQFLESKGIDAGSSLIIRKEISHSQKSRNFINHQLASQSLLSELGEKLFHISSQHAAQKLNNLNFHRESLDNFANLTSLVKEFSLSFEKELALKKKKQELLASESQRFREMEALKRDIQEIDEAALQKGEEESVFEEYTLFSTSESRLKLCSDILTVPSLLKWKALLKQLAEIDSSTEEVSRTFTSGVTEIEEAVFEIKKYQASIEFNPEKMDRLSERLKQIAHLKKKYGPDFDDILTTREESQKRLDELEQMKGSLDTLDEEIRFLEVSNNEKAKALSQKREEAKTEFERTISQKLHELNMPHAQFFVSLIPQPRNSFGDEKVEFSFQPNAGGKAISIRQSASGGELSRIMLALTHTLRSHAEKKIFVFDEIDANIGGETSRLIGQKLKELAAFDQILTITHFPQVASFADFHFSVQKKEIAGTAVTTIHLLEGNSIQQELKRMVGAAS